MSSKVVKKIPLRDLDVVKLSYFQEEMMVKEDPIKTGEELEKEADQENSVTVDRPVDRTQ